MKAHESNEKHRRFEEIIEEVLKHDLQSAGEGFNFADAEWVAAETKALGLLESQHDAELLAETIAKHTSVSRAVCRDEIVPALQYRAALDTQSSYRIEGLIRVQGWSRVARAIGISKPTLEKLVTGGSRGPLFRHMPVSSVVVEKARVFLATQSH